MKKRKEVIIGAIVLLLVTLALLGLTYAYYKTRIIGNEKQKLWSDKRTGIGRIVLFIAVIHAFLCGDKSDYGIVVMPYHLPLQPTDAIHTNRQQRKNH